MTEECSKAWLLTMAMNSFSTLIPNRNILTETANPFYKKLDILPKKYGV